MVNIVIWGYGFAGTLLFNQLRRDSRYNVIGFADNSHELQKYYVNNQKVMDLGECKDKKNKIDFQVIIAAGRWFEVGLQLEKENIPVLGVYIDGEIRPYKQVTFKDLYGKREIKLYAGDICDEVNLNDPDLYGLSICKGDKKHIYHDITKRYPLSDGVVSSYVAEHVLEHIEYDVLPSVINEIYRILKKGAKFRICLPDYNSPWLKQLSLCNKDGEVLFDANGGGRFYDGKVEGGGHLWFPTYDKVKACLDETQFKNVQFIRYRNKDESVFKKDFDNSKEYLYRMVIDRGDDDANIVVDCIK